MARAKRASLMMHKRGRSDRADTFRRLSTAGGFGEGCRRIVGEIVRRPSNVVIRTHQNESRFVSVAALLVAVAHDLERHAQRLSRGGEGSFRRVARRIAGVEC